jgi:hypothetical protein
VCCDEKIQVTTDNIDSAYHSVRYEDGNLVSGKNTFFLFSSQLLMGRSSRLLVGCCGHTTIG